MTTNIKAEAAATAARQAEQEQAEDSASVTARGVGGFMAILGAILCATPIAAIGAAMFAFGGIVWLLAPQTAEAEQRVITEVEAGNSGCGALLAVVGMVVIIVVLAGMVALAAGLAVNGGGL